MKPEIYFVVELLRYNDRNGHSYVIGVYDDENEALKDAWDHMVFRAGKYGAEISGFKVNGGDRVYHRSLDCWDAFARSCKDTAENLKKMLAERGLAKPEELNGFKVVADPNIPADQAEMVGADGSKVTLVNIGSGDEKE